LEIFKKALRDPSAVDLDHYGRGQTRSEYGPYDQVSSKSVNAEGQKCRSETHRQTDRQTRLKIRALKVLQSGQQTDNGPIA